MTLLFIYLFTALIFSFLCSIMESVLLSTPMSFLIVNAEKGRRGASFLMRHKKQIDKPLAAILSLNTIAHTIGAAGVGAQAVVVFGEKYFGIISALMTIAILVLTEIIPKTIGARYWSNLTSFAGYTIQMMIVLMYPLVIVSVYITRLISKKQQEHTISREEISALVNIGEEKGIFGDKENKIIQNIIRLKTVKVTEMMTPRVVVTVADEEMTIREFQTNKEYLKFSRIPVYFEKEDNITGYVLRQKVFEKLAEKNFSMKLKELKRDIVVVAETTPIFSVWELLLEKKEHIALIVNEYGSMDGIITMEDIIETILGFEIVDEKDTITDMQQYARERWKLRQEKYRQLENQTE